ncbi:tetratricopeptide repeat protein [Casimicrobium huifangae]|uniref:tetratricopeptide repeat protein n=1 Tax=Casimicrobium huifangae TaxID=2591109 RepID=UPI003784F929
MRNETLIHTAGDPVRPSIEEALNALRAIETSALFSQSARHRKFLRHLIECWARHDLAQLREISLGVTVFGRASATFDPALDSIVRVEARRLRARLARYYANEGAHDPVRITLEPGSYIPGVEHTKGVTERGGASDAALGLILRSDGDADWRDVLAELGGFLAGTRRINVAATAADSAVDEPSRYVVTLEREPTDDAAEAAIALRLVSPADHPFGRLPATITLPVERVAQNPVTSVGLRLGYSLLGVGLAAGWCPEPPTVTPRYLDDEPSRDRYHRAELAFRQRSIAGYEAALKIYESLLDDGVHGAEVHAGYARCCVALAGMIAMPVRVAMPLAREHAELALALDEGCGAAHCVVAQVAYLHDRQWEQALRHYLRGIQRCPRHAALHHGFAFALMYRGDFDLADRAFQTAIMLDPFDLQMRIQRWLVPYYRGHYDKAIRGWQDVLAAAPEHLLASTLVGAGHLAAGRPQQALSYYHSACDRQPQHPIGHAGLAQAFAMLGDEAKAREHLQALEHKASVGYVSPYLFAMVHCRLGDVDSAFAWLRRSASEPDFNFVCAAVDPTFRTLHAEPRWAELCVETRLPLLPVP